MPEPFIFTPASFQPAKYDCCQCFVANNLKDACSKCGHTRCEKCDVINENGHFHIESEARIPRYWTCKECQHVHSTAELFTSPNDVADIGCACGKSQMFGVYDQSGRLLPEDVLADTYDLSIPVEIERARKDIKAWTARFLATCWSKTTDRATTEKVLKRLGFIKVSLDELQNS